MENKEIIEGNKLIAFFMDLTDNNYGQQFIVENNKDWVSASNLKFHTSWDWLMPVVEKIKKLEFEFNTFSDYTKTEKYRNEVRISELSVDKYCRILIRNTDMLDAIFNAVVEFIKWYNETQPNEQ